MPYDYRFDDGSGVERPITERDATRVLNAAGIHMTAAKRAANAQWRAGLGPATYVLPGEPATTLRVDYAPSKHQC